MFVPVRRRTTLLRATSVALCAFLPCVLPGSAADGQAADAQAAARITELQAVENSWSSALNKRDQYGLENVLSPQLVDIAATGDVTTRNQDIAKLFVKEALPLSMSQKVITVRALNESFVLVNGTYVIRWPEPAGAATPGTVDEKGIFTQIFEAVNGRWICLNSQRTVVAEQMPVAKTKASAPKTKSNAAEPFHIPLVYKGAQSTAPATAPQPAPPN